MALQLTIHETFPDDDPAFAVPDTLREIANSIESGNTSGFHPGWSLDNVRPVAERDIVGVVRTTVAVPVVPFPGGSSQSDLYAEAARHLRGGYAVGGSNLTTAVIRLLEDVSHALSPAALPPAPQPVTPRMLADGTQAAPEARVSRDGIDVTITREDDGEGNLGDPYVIIDTVGHSGRLKIDLNDGPIWDGDPEKDDVLPQAERLMREHPAYSGPVRPDPSMIAAGLQTTAEALAATAANLSATAETLGSVATTLGRRA